MQVATGLQTRLELDRADRSRAADVENVGRPGADAAAADNRLDGRCQVVQVPMTLRLDPNPLLVDHCQITPLRSAGRVEQVASQRCISPVTRLGIQASWRSNWSVWEIRL